MLILNANEFDGNLKIAAGANAIFDVFLKATRAGDANGSVKINIKDHLIANGQVKATKGTGNGDIVVEFVKSNKKVKAETKFTVQSPNYNLILTFYPEFGQDNKKKFSLSTTNKVQPYSFDSK